MRALRMNNSRFANWRAPLIGLVILALAVSLFGALGGAVAEAQTASDPGVPTQLSAVWSSGEVTLSWQAPTSDGGSAVNGYEYRYWVVDEDAADNWTSLSADALSVTVDELTDDVAYRFELRAVNAVGSGASDTIDAMPLALREGDVRLVLGSRSEGMIQVFLNQRWGKVCDDGFAVENAQVTCRQLGYASGDVVEPTPEMLVPGSPRNTSPFEMDNVFCRGCEDRLTDCPYLNQANCFSIETVAVACDTAALGPPRNVLFIPGEHGGRLVWNAPRSDGGSPVIRYEYRVREANGAFGDWIAAGRNLTSNVANPSGGGTWRFELRAVNADGPSPLTGVGTVPINSFTLVDSHSHFALGQLRDGDTIQLAELPTDGLAIRADVLKGADVRAMELSLSGPLSHGQTEQSAPWSLFGDEASTKRYLLSDSNNRRFDARYSGRSLPPGEYTLSGLRTTTTRPTGSHWTASLSSSA